MESQKPCSFADRRRQTESLHCPEALNVSGLRDANLEDIELCYSVHLQV